jgi:predicted DCC family thiol-disulfide oxidoreductase YuxK
MGTDSVLNVVRRVVVFDTSCLLCSKFIRILLKHSNGRLQYTGFESEFAKKNLPENLLNYPETVVFYDEATILLRSEAVLAIVKELKYPIKILRVFKYFPLKWRDKIYNWIAKNRYEWFGKSDTCFLPTPEQRSHFLD